MSIGIGGFARIVVQDELTVIYEYGAYNLNKKEYCNKDHNFDGTITIDKTSLVEPEIHEKIKKHPSGRKERIVKRVPREYHIGPLLENGKIIVENSRFCWKYNGEIGIIAAHLIWEIFDEYQIQGELPEHISYNV